MSDAGSSAHTRQGPLIALALFAENRPNVGRNSTEEVKEAAYYTAGLLTRVSPREPALPCRVSGLLKGK